MYFEHPNLEKFEPFLQQVLDIAFTSGIRALESKEMRFSDLKDDETAKKVFIRGCHYGYDKAQQRIGAKVLALDSQYRHEQARLKELRRQRNDEAKSVALLLRILQGRQLVLRRIIDTMVYSIVAPDDWIMRRLGDDEPRSIDPRVLDRTLRYAHAKNEESRYRFAVVSDLSTLIHMGDLFEVSWSPNEGKQWKIIELKEGRINSLLSGILGEKAGDLSQEDTDNIARMLGRDAVRQAKRMQRQSESRRQFSNLITTDEGIDFRTRTKMRLTSEVTVVEDYENDVDRLVEQASARGYASTSIDGCLHLIAVKGDRMPFGKHTLVPMLHLSSHLARHGKLPCDDTLVEQWTEFKLKAPIVDVVAICMRVPCAKTVFSWLEVSRSRQIDLAIGKIKLVAYFDIESFVDGLRSDGIKCTWVSGKDADDIRKISSPIPGSNGAYGLKVQLPDGSEQILMNGFFSRVYLYLSRPSSLISMINSFHKEQRQLDQKLTPEKQESCPL